MRKFDVQSEAGELPVGRAVAKNLALGTSENQGRGQTRPERQRAGVELLGRGSQPPPT